MKKAQAISAGHGTTLGVAKEVLMDGGNAFDAAVAAYVAMFVTEPCMASAGAGGLAMCYTPQKGPILLDFFTQTPQVKEKLDTVDFEPIPVDFGNATETFYGGLASVAVPGAIAGICELQKKFGTRPLSVLLQPAMELAKKGVRINDFQAIDINLLKEIIQSDPSLKSQFFRKGEVLKEGDILRLPMMADFLDFLSKEGQDGFYKGEIGAQVARDSIERGGFIRRPDFEKYEIRWKDVISLNRYDHKLLLPNGPSLGGALMALLYRAIDTNSENWVNAIADTRARYELPDAIKNGAISQLPNLGFRFETNHTVTRGTSHFNILDKWGNAIALSTTIGEGSGYTIPNTQMHMNNMMGEPFLLPAGFHSWEENVRLNSMMTPTMAIDNNSNLVFLGGSGGASRIPYMIAQVLDHVFKDGMSLEDSTIAGRLHVHEGVIHVEGNSLRYSQHPEMKIHEWDYQSLFFGGVHSIYRNPRRNSAIEASGDQRRSGVAEVF